MDVDIVDKSGEPLHHLVPADVTLLDNNQPAKITSWQEADAPAADNPVEVILVLDSVNVSSSQLSRATKEVEEFLLRDGGRLPQPVSVYRLTNSDLSTTGPSVDGHALAGWLEHWGKQRILWESMNQSFRMLEQNSYETFRTGASIQGLGSIAIDQRDRPGRKLLLWLGPGWPVREEGELLFDSITELSTRLREARITLDDITGSPTAVADSPTNKALAGALSAHDAVTNDLALPVLAIQTGGTVQATEDVAGAIAKCMQNADAYYQLSFDPPRTAHMDEFHSIQVQLKSQAAVVRTRNGYYDEPSFYDVEPKPAERLTIAQLEQMLAPDRRESDGEIARHLAAVELTERLTTSHLDALQARLPGSKSRTALTALADTSALLPPPQEDSPPDPIPSLDEEREMIARAIQSLEASIPRFPNLFAQRTTVRYEEMTGKNDPFWKGAPSDQTLHPGDVAKVTVMYSSSGEVVDAPTHKHDKSAKAQKYLVARGTFGPILSSVLAGAMAPGGQLHWLRWERSANGKLAVFQYRVEQGPRLFDISYCCLPVGDGTTAFRRMSPYRGEIALNPETGAVLRLVMEAELDTEREPDLPIDTFATVIEYGPVVIGGSPYICPVRSISISRGRASRTLHEWGANFGVYGPFETMLNDVSFSDYHLFRSDSRILTDVDEAPDGKSTPPAPPKSH